MSTKTRIFAILALIVVVVLGVNIYLYSVGSENIFTLIGNSLKNNEEEIAPSIDEGENIDLNSDAKVMISKVNISLECPENWREVNGRLYGEANWFDFGEADKNDQDLAEYLKDVISYSTHNDGTKTGRDAEIISEGSVVISENEGYYISAFNNHSEVRYFQALYGVDINGRTYVFDYTSEISAYEGGLADLDYIIKSVKITQTPAEPQIVLVESGSEERLRDMASISASKAYQLYAISGNESMSNIVVTSPSGKIVLEAKALETTKVLVADSLELSEYEQGYYKIVATDVDGSTSVFYFSVSE